jgi:hypothetical protein
MSRTRLIRRAAFPVPTILIGTIVTDHTPTITATVTQDEAGSPREDFYLSEYDATGTFYAQVIISIPGPLTLGSVVTAVGTADTYLASTDAGQSAAFSAQ